MKSEKLSDFFTHLGWALWGQECNCGSNPFNWLAERLDPYMNDPNKWDDDTMTLLPGYWAERALSRIGFFFYDIGIKTMPDTETTND